MRFVTCLFRPRTDMGVTDYSYDETWVAALARNARRWHPDAEVCVLTDFPDSVFSGMDVEVLPLTGRNEGFSALMECYRPEAVKDRAFLVGLDQIVVGDLSALWDRSESHIAPMDPHFGVSRDRQCNAFVLVDGKSATRIWCSWERKGGRKDVDYRMFTRGKDGKKGTVGVFSEMRWLSVNHRSLVTWDSVSPGAILSYKAHIQPSGVLPSTAKLVYFHGRPKQTDLRGVPWVDENWTF